MTVDNFLLLRGLGRHQKHWGPFPTELEAGLGIKAHCLDLPGFGTEHARKAPVTVPAMVDDVRARWASLKAEHDGPWGLMAISLGGMVAMNWADRFADDFDAVVIINSTARNLGGVFERMQPEALRKLARALVLRDPVERERKVLEATSIKLETLDEDARANAALDAFAPMRARNVVRQITAAGRFRAPSEFPAHTLLLASEGDRLADKVCSERLSERTGAELRLHPSAGHDLPRDAAGWIVEQLKDRFF
jgi:alpha-beta hydrolase superfamily lysophospholipase